MALPAASFDLKLTNAQYFSGKHLTLDTWPYLQKKERAKRNDIL